MNTDPLKALWKAAFGDTDEAIDTFFATAFAEERCRYLEAGGRIVSALYWLDCSCQGQKLAYIYAVATDPAFRGKGLASRLMEATHDQLKALGYGGAVLKPADGLFPFYERLGYRTCGYIRRFSATAGTSPAPLKILSTADYAATRRRYLPENGIIQEGETLRYLETFARFYEGENALISVAKDAPLVLEYLGDPGEAPGLLAALGIDEAQIPTAGREIPYAMYCPLTCKNLPGYLGIALE